MRVLIFGATGMVGQGVLRECLAAPDVQQVTCVGRTPVDCQDPRLGSLVHADLMDLQSRESELQGFDACFYCLGVSSAGMSEEAYRHITFDLTVCVASLLARLNPAMVFVYVSGAGTDSSEQGRSMWARVKGSTENALKNLTFRGVYLFRPGIIKPLHGIRSKTSSYRWFYRVTNPLLSLMRWLRPQTIVTTEDIGQAMLNAARYGNGRVVVEARDMLGLARNAGPRGMP